MALWYPFAFFNDTRHRVSAACSRRRLPSPRPVPKYSKTLTPFQRYRTPNSRVLSASRKREKIHPRKHSQPPPELRYRRVHAPESENQKKSASSAREKREERTKERGGGGGSQRVASADRAGDLRRELEITFPARESRRANDARVDDDYSAARARARAVFSVSNSPRRRRRRPLCIISASRFFSTLFFSSLIFLRAPACVKCATLRVSRRGEVATHKLLVFRERRRRYRRARTAAAAGVHVVRLCRNAPCCGKFFEIPRAESHWWGRVIVVLEIGR